MKVGIIRRPVPVDPKLYVFQEIKSDCVSCLLLYSIFFVGEKVSADCLKYYVIPKLTTKYRLKLVQNVALNNVIDKVKQRLKTSYKLFE